MSSDSTDPRDERVLASSPTWLAMGFRPFFLGAALFACVEILLWLQALMGKFPASTSYAPLTLWHAHEMIFGFTMAVVAGFLLTAARNWTKRNTLHGYPLLLLVLLWLFGRIAMTGVLPLAHGVIAISVLAFQFVLTAVIAAVIFRARSRRNYGIVAVLLLLSMLALIAHLDWLGYLNNAATPAIHGALHLIILLNVIMGGRIIPLFTRNRTGLQSICNQPNIDRAAIIATVLVALLATLNTTLVNRELHMALVFAAALCGLLQLLRMRSWGTRIALRVPMLAVLHAGYVWVGVGYLLMAAALLTPALTLTVALHAHSIGVIGTMTLGMMARVTQGHTGRIIKASPLLIIAFVSVNAAVFGRLAAALLPPSRLVSTWLISGSLFATAFALYLASALRALLSPRPDHRPG